MHVHREEERARAGKGGVAGQERDAPRGKGLGKGKTHLARWKGRVLRQRLHLRHQVAGLGPVHIQEPQQLGERVALDLRIAALELEGGENARLEREVCQGMGRGGVAVSGQ